MKYAEIIAMYEVEASDRYFVREDDEFVERQGGVRMKLLNTIASQFGWDWGQEELLKGWSRGKKRKIRARLRRYFRNRIKELRALKKLELENVNL